jgi:DNA repair photolyase
MRARWVDVAATVEMAKETIELCQVILELTHWQIRLLSKSSLLPIVAEAFDTPEHKNRLIYGFSTGTPDDNLAAAFEEGTAKVSKRIKALHELQDAGFRTFGMICPSLPYEHTTEYLKFSKTICDMIRVDRCENVWAEVINVRGRSFANTYNALLRGGFEKEARLLYAVSRASGHQVAWEQYARDTFMAHTEFIPVDKLLFLQYVQPKTKDWWAAQPGAVLLGKAAQTSKQSRHSQG